MDKLPADSIDVVVAQETEASASEGLRSPTPSSSTHNRPNPTPNAPAPDLSIIVPATEAELRASLTCVGMPARRPTPAPAVVKPIRQTPQWRRWVSGLPNLPSISIEECSPWVWTQRHLLHSKGGVAIATVLSFGVGIAVSAQGLSVVPPMPLPYSQVASTLGTLPNLAEQAWLDRPNRPNASQRLDFPIPAAFQGKTIEKIPLPSNQKVIALTFDDGPSVGFSNEVLYILDKYNIKATFFLLGRHVQQYPERVLQMHLKGHALANHSWSHPYRQLSPERAAAEINHTSTWIQKAAGVKSQLFRPPGGFLNNGLADYAKQQGQTVVMWSADSKDFNASAPTIIQNVLQQAGPGGIILLHDGGGDRTPTVVALPQIIEALLQQGYTFVTIPELMDRYEAETQGTQAPPNI